VAATAAWSLGGKVLTLALAVLTFPVATGTLIALGLADTWLDFRGRMGPSEAGGYDAD
jgi:hypothetical protein